MDRVTLRLDARLLALMIPEGDLVPILGWCPHVGVHYLLGEGVHEGVEGIGRDEDPEVFLRDEHECRVHPIDGAPMSRDVASAPAPEVPAEAVSGEGAEGSAPYRVLRAVHLADDSAGEESSSFDLSWLTEVQTHPIRSEERRVGKECRYRSTRTQ